VTATTGARPGRQRSQAADEAILAATLEELFSVGYGGLTVAAVIARAGVSSATLYRRWPTKQQLVAAALASMHQEVVDVDTGTLAGDLLALARFLADTMTVDRVDVTEDVLAELRRNPEFRVAIADKFQRPRLEQLDRILDRARARGELGPGLDTEVAMSFLSGPLYNRHTVTQEPLSDAFVRLAATATVGALLAIAPPS
jgi:AcrR family transcriptional regulator